MSIELSQRLRKVITEIRRKSYPIADLIPLLSQAADALSQQPAAPVAQVSDLFPSVRNKLHSQGFDADAPLFTHPAPGVPADVARDAERYQWLKDRNNKAQIGVGHWESDDHFTWLCDLDADAAIDAAMLAANPHSQQPKEPS